MLRTRQTRALPGQIHSPSARGASRIKHLPRAPLTCPSPAGDKGHGGAGRAPARGRRLEQSCPDRQGQEAPPCLLFGLFCAPEPRRSQTAPTTGMVGAGWKGLCLGEAPRSPAPAVPKGPQRCPHEHPTAHRAPALPQVWGRAAGFGHRHSEGSLQGTGRRGGRCMQQAEATSRLCSGTSSFWRFLVLRLHVKEEGSIRSSASLPACHSIGYI